MVIDRESGVFLEVAGLGEEIPVLGQQGRKGITGKVKILFAFGICPFKIPAEFPGIGLEKKDDVQGAAKNGDHQDKENPGQLIGRFFGFIKDVYTYHDAQYVKDPAKILERDAGPGN
jgi:hypothetical protein